MAYPYNNIKETLLQATRKKYSRLKETSMLHYHAQG
jgi:hypothetical protein